MESRGLYYIMTFIEDTKKNLGMKLSPARSYTAVLTRRYSTLQYLHDKVHCSTNKEVHTLQYLHDTVHCSTNKEVQYTSVQTRRYSTLKY